MTPYLAEFWNSVSNLGFILVGVYGMWTTVRLGLRARWFYFSFLIFATGMFSLLYHATLTWIGLKLDETFENLACALIIYLGEKRMWMAMVHQLLASIGIFFVSHEWTADWTTTRGVRSPSYGCAFFLSLSLSLGDGFPVHRAPPRGLDVPRPAPSRPEDGRRPARDSHPSHVLLVRRAREKARCGQGRTKVPHVC